MNREEILKKLSEVFHSEISKKGWFDKTADWHIVELENATKELKQKLEDERYIKATVIENAKREARELSRDLFEAIRCDYANIDDNNLLYEKDLDGNYLSGAVIKELIFWYKTNAKYYNKE